MCICKIYIHHKVPKVENVLVLVTICDEFSEQTFNSYCASCSAADCSLPQIFFHIFFTQFDSVLLNWASRAAEKPPTASFCTNKVNSVHNKISVWEIYPVKAGLLEDICFCHNHTTRFIYLFIFIYNKILCQNEKQKIKHALHCLENNILSKLQINKYKQSG